MVELKGFEEIQKAWQRFFHCGKRARDARLGHHLAGNGAVRARRHGGGQSMQSLCHAVESRVHQKRRSDTSHHPVRGAFCWVNEDGEDVEPSDKDVAWLKKNYCLGADVVPGASRAAELAFKTPWVFSVYKFVYTCPPHSATLMSPPRLVVDTRESKCIQALQRTT